jgi:hypothetical protein
MVQTDGRTNGQGGKPPVIPDSSVPVFKFENFFVPASRVPKPVIPVSVIPVFI